MAGFLGYALAGAAEGIGNSMVQQAREKRQFAMEYARNQWAMEREDRQFGRQLQRDEMQHDRSLEREAFRHSLTSGGLGTGDDGQAAPAGISSNQQRQIDLIMKRYSERDPVSGSYFVNDWDGLRKSLLQVDGGEQYYRKMFGEPPRPASPSQLATPRPVPQNRDEAIDGQAYQFPDGSIGVWNARDDSFDFLEPRDGDTQEASPRNQDATTPSRPQPRKTDRANQTRQERAAEWDFRESPAARTIRGAAQGPLSGPRSDRAAAPEEIPQYGRQTAVESASAQAGPDPLEMMQMEDAQREISRERARLESQRRNGVLGEAQYRRRIRELFRRAERFGIEIEGME